MKRFLRDCAIGAVYVSQYPRLVGRWHRGEGVTRIVVFHRVADRARFARQLRRLQETCRVLSLEDFLAGRTEGARLSACLTFDDGYADWVEAAPMLQAAGVPATFFVCSGFIEAGERGRGAEYARERLGLRTRAVPATWRDLRNLLAVPGFRIGGHTRSHLRLSLADQTLARDEVAVDREVLQDRLGVPILDFAYPFGDPASITQRVTQLVAAAGYRSARTLVPGANLAATPRHALHGDGLDDIEPGWLMTAWLEGAYDPIKRGLLRSLR